MKHKIFDNDQWRGMIEEKNPLKQGLKQKTPDAVTINRINWREESIKTRIETLLSNDIVKLITSIINKHPQKIVTLPTITVNAHPASHDNPNILSYPYMLLVNT